MRFKYRKSMKLPKRRQERIYCLCQSIEYLSPEKYAAVKAACDKTGYGDAVFEYITTDASSVYVSQKYYISEKWLAVKTAEVFRMLANIL